MLLSKKQCQKCLQSLDVAFFKKDARLKSGFSSVCKNCHSSYEAAAREKGQRSLYQYDPNRGPQIALKWREANRDKDRLKANRRRKGVQIATPPWVDQEDIKQIYTQAVMQNLSVDHIVPINHTLVCGLNVPWNLQLISLKENLSKSNKFTIGVETN